MIQIVENLLKEHMANLAKLELKDTKIFYKTNNISI